MFETKLVELTRGIFEVFTYGQEEPLAYTHLYSEYNSNGNIMSQELSEHYKVYVINLRGSGQSDDQTEDYTYSMDDAIHELDAVRKALDLEKWTFAGHCTGGLLVLKYGVRCPESSTKIKAGRCCGLGDEMSIP